MTAYIDPEELPFTRDELFDAGCRFLPVEQARLMADHLAHLGPDAVRTRARRRKVWRKGGVPSADTMLLHYWAYPDELLPALASLSGELAARVDALSKRLRP